MWTNFAVTCPGRGPMHNLIPLVVADYWTMHRHPFILKIFVILPEIRVTAVSKPSMDPCLDSPCVDFRVGEAGGLTARVRAVGVNRRPALGQSVSVPARWSRRV